MLSFDEARERIVRAGARVGSERVSLDDAVGRVLADGVRAHVARPAFDYSAMDGYAVATADLSGDGPFALRLLGESRTGGFVPQRVEPGTICRIFTGAVLPDRADAVVMQEDVTVREGMVHFERRPKPGEHVRKTGEDIAPGTLAFEAGTRLAPHHIALLATLEHARVTVARRPVVSILSTGDELREPGEPDRPGSVVESNGPALAALVRTCGGIPRRLPFARDEGQATRDALRNALSGADLVVTVGGVSVGDHDVVRSVLGDVGIELDFWRVAIKPGKPLAVGRAGSCSFLGLPGNPASAIVTFMLFGAPLLRAMQGDLSALPSWVPARMTRAISHAPGRTEFLRARLSMRDESLWADPLAQQASGSIPSIAWADALIRVPDEVAQIEAGAHVRVLRFADV